MGVLALILLGLYMAQGYEVVYVPTGSMEPNLPIGSLALIQLGARPIVGQVAVADELGEPLIHRIIWINDSSATFGFRGDNTNSTTVLPFSSIVGVMVIALPLLGYLPMSLRSAPLVWILGSVALLAVAAGFSLAEKRK